MGGDKGWYVDLLCHQSLEGSIPGDPEEIRSLLGIKDRDWPRVWVRLEPCFPVVDGGRRRNGKMATVQGEYEQFLNGKRTGGQARIVRSARDPAGRILPADHPADHPADTQQDVQQKPSRATSINPATHPAGDPAGVQPASASASDTQNLRLGQPGLLAEDEHRARPAEGPGEPRNGRKTLATQPENPNPGPLADDVNAVLGAIRRGHS